MNRKSDLSLICVCVCARVYVSCFSKSPFNVGCASFRFRSHAEASEDAEKPLAGDSVSSRNDINDDSAQRVHDAACLRARTRKRRV